MSPAPALVAVLAGGRSRRLGAPKAMVELAGRPLVAHPLDAARAAGLEAIVVAPPGAPLPPLDVAVHVEPAGKDRHPARGILAALGAAGGHAVVALACDLPLVPPALLAHLAAAQGTVVPRHGGRDQPLCARWAPASAEALRAAVHDGTALHAAAAAAGAVILGEEELRRFGDPARYLLDIDTPDDLARVASLLG